MRTMDRDGQVSNNASGGQARPKAAKTPQPRGLNGLLETVRQKMAFTIRGI